MMVPNNTKNATKAKVPIATATDLGNCVVIFIAPVFWAAHQCGLQRKPALASFTGGQPRTCPVHCIPPFSRLLHRAGFVALRQTFVRRCQNSTMIGRDAAAARHMSGGPCTRRARRVTMVPDP